MWKEKYYYKTRKINTMHRMRCFLAMVGLVAMLIGQAGGAVSASSKVQAPISARTNNPERALIEFRSECEKQEHCQGGESSSASRRICIYKCMSEECYQEVYGVDELEEGEVDSERYKTFGNCFRKAWNEKKKLRA